MRLEKPVYSSHCVRVVIGRGSSGGGGGGGSLPPN